MEKAQVQYENPADVKAAERMVRLYDEITKDNSAKSWQVIEKIIKINRKSKWVRDSTWDTINACLIVDYRIKKDKEAQPSIAIIDSQTTKNSISCCENVGIDGGKLIKGRKRFYLVDTLGNLLDSFVVSANSYDGTTAIDYWESLSLYNCLLDNIKYIYADGTFGGTFSKEMNEKHSIFVEIPKIPKKY